MDGIKSVLDMVRPNVDITDLREKMSFSLSLLLLLLPLAETIRRLAWTFAEFGNKDADENAEQEDTSDISTKSEMKVCDTILLILSYILLRITQG